MSNESNRWRVGTKLGRTLYRNNQLVGMMDTPELAAEVVAVMNKEAPNDREGITNSLSRESNRVWGTMTQNFPTNIIDQLVRSIRAGKTSNLLDE